MPRTPVHTEQEEFIEMMTKDVWQLEQRLTGGTSAIPRSTSTKCFGPGTACSQYAPWAPKVARYHSMTGLAGMSTEGRQLVADNAQQFDWVRSLADGEMEYLHGVIEFYQTVLSVKSTLLGQAQNEKVQQLTEASYTERKKSRRSPPGAAIFFAPTLIGTVYGVNFDHMPELHWVIGYPLALLAMVLLSVGLYLMFRRRKWL